MRVQNTLYYAYSDHLGNIAAYSAFNGTYTPNSLARYEPYGNYRGAVPTSNPAISDRGFTGQRHNNTGDNAMALIYMNARYYLPETGRFISADTIVPDPHNPQSYNRYSYVRNNPVNLTDPSGHRPCGAFCPGDTINSQEIRHGSNWLGSWDLEQQQLNSDRTEDIAFTGSEVLCSFYNPCDYAFGGTRVLSGEAGTLEKIFLVAPIAPGIVGRWADDGIGWLARKADAILRRCSFSADTVVMTEDGLVPISEIDVNDRVLAYDEETGEIGYYPVTAVWSHEDPVIVYLTIDGETIETTPEHPFYTAEGRWLVLSRSCFEYAYFLLSGYSSF